MVGINIAPVITTHGVNEKVGVIIGYYNMEASRCTDMGRISAVRYNSTDRVKSRRKKLHAKK